MAYAIGRLKLKSPYFLAPMAKVNDIAFRTLCKKAGAGLVYTGMANPLTRKKIVLDDKPAIQIFSTTEKGIPNFVRKHQVTVRLFDFNLGCPAYIAKREGFGAFLHDKLGTIDKILAAIRDSTKKPVTVKLRKSRQALKIVKIAEKYCDAIAIHPRTEYEKYSGFADVVYAKKLKEKTSLPIIYSGDVTEKTADKLLKQFDFVMIGRRAIGNPNVFGKLVGKESNFGFEDYLKLAFKYKLNSSQIKSQAVAFTKSRSNAKELRISLSGAKNIDEIRKILS